MCSPFSFCHGMNDLLLRINGKYRNLLAHRMFRRIVVSKASDPIVSFSFDDAPLSAFIAGGSILKACGARATYYVSLGLLGADSAGGSIASHCHLQAALAEGHELGCHTYDHRDAWHTPAKEFEQSVLKNRRVLAKILPGTTFTTLAYPISNPRPCTKGRVEKLFDCCRGGGQTFNAGAMDLNLVKAYFLDKRIKTSMDEIKILINNNSARRGWLIFATHDVEDSPSPYGCTPEFLNDVAEYSAHSGALLLPVGAACKKILAPSSSTLSSKK